MYGRSAETAPWNTAASQAAAAAAAAAAPASAVAPRSLVPHASRVEFQQLLDLIAKCNGSATDPALLRLLPHVKGWLRGHDELAPMGVELLLLRLRDPSAQVRMNLVRVADTLFLRSKAFRTALLEQMHAFLALAVGIGPGADAHVPKPPAKAKELQLLVSMRARAQQEELCAKLLRLGCEFVQSRLGGVYVPTALESEQAADGRRSFQRQRTQRLLAVRFARLTSEFDGQERELKRLLREIESSLDLLFPAQSGDKQLLQEYMLQGRSKAVEQKSAVKAESPGSPPAQRRRVSTGSASSARSSSCPDTRCADAATSVDAATLSPAPAASDAALDETIEWESSPPAAASAASVAAATSPPAATAASSTNAPVPPAPPAVPLEGAAAAFGEFQAADASWWLDELGSQEATEEEEAVDDEENKEDDDEEDQSSSGGAAAAAYSASSSSGVHDRSFQLQIEFGADFGVDVENEENALVFASMREAWANIQRSLLPLLNEWIDTLTRIEFERADLSHGASIASSAASPAVSDSRLAALRHQRDSYLRRSIALREQIFVLQQKCARLGVQFSTLASDRSGVVRRETERDFTTDQPGAEPAGGEAGAAAELNRSLRTGGAAARAPASATAALTRDESAAHTRHAAALLQKRAAAEKRATTKIRSVKRKYAQTLEAQRVAARSNPPPPKPNLEEAAAAARAARTKGVKTEDV